MSVGKLMVAHRRRNLETVWKTFFGHKFRPGREMPFSADFSWFFYAPAVRNVHHV
jgi:hypothetical protein